MKMAGFMKGGNCSFINRKGWACRGIHCSAKQQMGKRVEAFETIVGNGINRLRIDRYASSFLYWTPAFAGVTIHPLRLI